MLNSQSGSASFYIYAVATALVSMLYAAMFAIYPAIHDDAWYVAHSVGQPGSWEYFVTTVDNCVAHWQYDTGRFANMLTAPFLALFPRWVFGVLTGALIWWMYLLGPKLSGVGWFSVGSAVWIAVVTFLFPWFNYMFLIVYAGNYVWSSVMALTLIWILMRKPGCRLWVVGVLAYFTGWIHEGISVPLIAGIATYALVRFRRPTPAIWVAMAGLALGIATLMLMPAFSNQVGVRSNHLVKGVWWETALNAIAYNIVFYLYVILVICGMLSKSVRCRMLADSRRGLALCLGALALGIVGTTIYLKFYAGPRMGIVNMLFCTLAALYILRNYFHLPLWIGRDWVRRGVTILMLIAAMVNLASAVVMQRRLTQEYADVARLLAQNEKGDNVVFYDRTPILFGPDLLKPSYSALNIYSVIDNIKILPACLKDLDPQSKDLQDLGEGLYLYRNCLIEKRAEANKWEYAIVEIENQDGRRNDSRAKVHGFKDIEGGDWCYLKINLQSISPNMRIRSAKLKR